MDYSVLASVGAVVLVLILFWLVQNRRPATISDAAGLVIEAERVAQIGVRAVQQLYESRDDFPAGQRYSEVERFLRSVFPDIQDQHVRMVIEAAVLSMKSARQHGFLPLPLNIDPNPEIDPGIYRQVPPAGQEH